MAVGILRNYLLHMELLDSWYIPKKRFTYEPLCTLYTTRISELRKIQLLHKVMFIHSSAWNYGWKLNMRSENKNEQIEWCYNIVTDLEFKLLYINFSFQRNHKAMFPMWRPLFQTKCYQQITCLLISWFALCYMWGSSAPTETI